MGLERVHFPRLRGDQLVHRTQAGGDFFVVSGDSWSRCRGREELRDGDVEATCSGTLVHKAAQRRIMVPRFEILLPEGRVLLLVETKALVDWRHNTA